MKGSGPCSRLLGIPNKGSWDSTQPSSPTRCSHSRHPFRWRCSTDKLAPVCLLLCGSRKDSQGMAMITLDNKISSKVWQCMFSSAPRLIPGNGHHMRWPMATGHSFFPCKLYLTFQRTLLHLVLGFMKKNCI